MQPSLVRSVLKETAKWTVAIIDLRIELNVEDWTHLITAIATTKVITAIMALTTTIIIPLTTKLLRAITVTIVLTRSMAIIMVLITSMATMPQLSKKPKQS
jgi:hypothetical protein